MMVSIREATSADLDVLYDVCLRTGRAGQDASGLYRDASLLGSIYVGPYVALPEGIGFVPVDERGVGGYVLGTLDTRSFEAACEERWWSTLRARHADPGASPSTPDDELRALLHRPATAPDEVVARHRAHLHIDVHPRLQGVGVGGRLMERMLAWLAEGGAAGVHLGVDVANERAIGFYRHLGFVPLIDVGDVRYMGRRLQ
jgi:ribosomal protein S18 acetylase RimI-like enzyme